MFLDKGEVSFFVLWIVNPLIILMYQNCSCSLPPQAHAEKVDAASAIERPFEKCDAKKSSDSCAL